MARSMFMISAYAFKGDSPDYRGFLVNKEDKLWSGPKKGVFYRYLVPGMGQMHFPIEDCVKLFVLDAARDYMKYQSGGTAYDGKAEAESFKAQQQLDFRSIREQVSHEPGTNKVLAAYRYDDMIESYMKKGKQYKNRESVLGLGDMIPDRRLEKVREALQGNIDDFKNEVIPEIHKEVRRLLVHKDFLYRGALDFVDDLAEVLKDEASALAAEGRNTNQIEFDDLGVQWTNLRPLVEDVVTADGAWDRITDRFQLGRAKELSRAFLNKADKIIVDKARNDLASQAIQLLLAELDHLQEALTTTFKTKVPAAISLIEDRRRVYVDRLLQGELGNESGVDHIRSINVLQESWRKAYFESQEQYRPTSVLGDLQARGWHPFQLLDSTLPKDATLAEHVAEQVIDMIIPSSLPDLALSPVDILNGSAEIKGYNPGQAIARQLHDLLQPQFPITAGHKNLGSILAKVFFCGGMDDGIAEALHNSSEWKSEDEFLHAESWESRRLTFFASYLPVGLAGCGPVKDVFETEYQQWKEENERTGGSSKSAHNELMRFLCFPRSDQWPNPTTFYRDIEEEKRHFALAMAVSEIFEPTVTDLVKMNKKGKTPKDKRYGLFQVGRASFWMWPFFRPNVDRPDEPSDVAYMRGKHLQLGVNISEAYQKYRSDETLVDHARKWADWLGEIWSAFFSVPEMKGAMNRVVDAIEERRERTRDAQQIELWDEIIRVIRAWVDETL